MANNMLTQSYSDLVTRVRAYENLINRGRILKRILPICKIEKEIARVKQEEITLQEKMNRAQQKAILAQQEKDNIRKDDAKLKRKIKTKQKRVKRLVKSAEKETKQGATAPCNRSF